MTSFLSQLPQTVAKRKKRLGRGLGSGRGAKSGRGTTRHQTARKSMPIDFEGGQGRMVKRFPLLRGKGKNKSKREKSITVNARILARFPDNAVVDRKAIIRAGISGPIKKAKVKLVGSVKLTKKLVIKLPVSHSLKKTIEAAGGRVENV